MARLKRVPGERPLYWMGSSKDDLMAFPEPVQDEIGTALSVAQFGGKHPSAKPCKGIGPGVLEIVDDYRTDTYRAVYTVRFERAAYAMPARNKRGFVWPWPSRRSFSRVGCRKPRRPVC